MKGLPKFALVFICVPLLAQTTPPTEPAALLEQAKQRLAAGQSLGAEFLLSQIVPLLRQANTLWGQSSTNDPRNAASLELEALLLRSAGKNTEAWQAEAAPLVARAPEIREATSGDQPSAELALALELQADVLRNRGRGTNADGPFRDRAAKIRGQLVSEVERRVRPDSASHAEYPVFRLTPSSGISSPSVVFRIDPEYSETARIAKYACTVLMTAIVNSQGVPENLLPSRGCGYGLDEKAAEAILRWRFQPGMKDGRPVAVRANIEVNFRLL